MQNTRLGQNPFAARYLRPGVMDYLFESQDGLEHLVTKLRRARGWGQIVGPHGTGKSTLAGQLLDELSARGVSCVALRLSAAGRQTTRMVAGRGALPGDSQSNVDQSQQDQQRSQWYQALSRHHSVWPLLSLRKMPAATQVIVDGFEQVPFWRRLYLTRILAARKCGLLITAHADCGLPTLWQTRASLEITQRIVRQLIARVLGANTLGSNDDVLQAVIEERYSQHGGNVREILFSLFDWFRQQPNNYDGLPIPSRTEI